MAVMKFHNDFHLGDCFNSLHFLIKLSAENEIACELACNPTYHKQLSQMIPDGSKVSLSSAKQPDSYNLWGYDVLKRWIGPDPRVITPDCPRAPGYKDLLKQILITHQRISNELQISCPYQSMLDVLYDEPAFVEDTCTTKYDTLLINSPPLSGQVSAAPFFQDLLAYNIIKNSLAEGRTIISTKKISNFPCTRDHGLSLVEIGQLSKHCQSVVGFTTAPFWMCMNKFTYTNCKQFITVTNDWLTFDVDDRFITMEMPK
jgi:hypothetical protein